jgi:hypothetical protein
MRRKFSITPENLLVTQQENEPDYCRAAIYPPVKAQLEKAIARVNQCETEFEELHKSQQLILANKQPTAMAEDWLVRWSASLDEMKALVSNPLIHTPTLAHYSWTSEQPVIKQYLRNYRLQTIHQLMEAWSKHFYYGSGTWRWCRHSDERDIRDYLYRDSPEPGGGNVFGQIRLSIPAETHA